MRHGWGRAVTAFVSQEVIVTTKRSVPAEDRWVLTSGGVLALQESELCICDIRIQGILFACPHCGTIYGTFKDASVQRANHFDKTTRS